MDVRDAGPGDVRGVAETIAEAFHADPIAVWAVPDEARRRGVYAGMAAALLEHVYLPHGLVHVTADGLGAAVWARPDPPPLGPAEREAVVALVKQAWGEFGDRGRALNAVTRNEHPDAAHYYLPFLAVRPEGQGRGIGSALLRRVLDAADREGKPAYLEATSERGAALYERHGFARLGEVALPGGPPLFPMLREPRPPQD